jgi:hypothetical protein
MQPPDRRAASQLQDSNVPKRPQLRYFVGEVDDPIGHGVLREEAAVAMGIGEQDERAAGEVRQNMQLVKELLELAVGRRALLSRNQAIDDGDSGTLLLDETTQQRHQPAQSLGFQGAEPANVIHVLRDHRFLEESHPAKMAEHPGVRFGEEGDVDRMPSARRMRETGLVAENRLARPWRSLHDVDACLDQATIENAIETWNPGRQSVKRRGWLAHLSPQADRSGRTVWAISP